MCGIVGVLGHDENANRALRVLKRLEYRGYDSAGIAVQQKKSPAELYREVGKLSALQTAYADKPTDGAAVIGHTRWATHGKPTVANAHPHKCGAVHVVHNGIIENYESLKGDLIENGAVFQSDTDTEVIAVLMDKMLSEHQDPMTAFHATIDQLAGAYAIVLMIDGHDDRLFAARHGSPMVLGRKDDEHFICSDALGLAGLIDQAVFLADGERVEVSSSGFGIFDEKRQPVPPKYVPSNIVAAEVSKGEFNHFMQKEIHEQPLLLQGVMSHYASFDPVSVDIDMGDIDFADATQIVIVACGTSLYAAYVSKYWFEKLARVPVRIEMASEFRYAEPQLIDGSLCVFISQSGETADTLSALKYSKSQGFLTMGLVNVMGSSIAREADRAIDILAGPEIGVASTKAFTCQLLVLGLLSLKAGLVRGALSEQSATETLQSLRGLPAHLQNILNMEAEWKAAAKLLAKAPYALFVGRGIMTPVAFEGALKLKEITYIPAEGYAAGELKHGPIALVSNEIPVVGLVSQNSLPAKTDSNLSEIASRDGQIILVTDTDETHVGAMQTLKVPASDEISSAIIFALPMQLIAYYAATHKGTDVDQPRNLAKSVTVE